MWHACTLKQPRCWSPGPTWMYCMAENPILCDWFQRDLRAQGGDFVGEVHSDLFNLTAYRPKTDYDIS